MKTLIQLDIWERKDHFNFFNQFEEPFFGVTVQVDCTKAYQKSKELNVSFFLLYLHQSLAAANEIAGFKQRILGNEVYQYAQVHASPTINRPNGTFGFSYINYTENFNDFSVAANIEIEKVQQSKGLIPALSGENVIHYSTIPWINFTALSHARAFSYKDSIPKISFGKMVEKDGKRMMPMSVNVHHGLMDGYHVAQYIDSFEQRLQQ